MPGYKYQNSFPFLLFFWRDVNTINLTIILNTIIVYKYQNSLPFLDVDTINLTIILNTIILFNFNLLKMRTLL